MGKEIRKLLLINKIAEDLIKREKIDKKEAIEKTKDMMRQLEKRLLIYRQKEKTYLRKDMPHSNFII